MHYLTPSLEVRSASPQGLIEGYASVFGGLDAQGHTVAPGAFRKSLAQHAARGTAPAMLWGHDQGMPIGRWLDLNEDGHGLRVVGQLNLSMPVGQAAFDHLAAGDVTGLSIGFTHRVADTARQPIIIKEADLFEISCVSVPADQAARITSIKSANKPATLRELEAGLVTLGYSRSEARSIAARGFTPAASALPDPSLDLAAALKAATLLFTKG